jgi:hypothetical protein
MCISYVYEQLRKTCSYCVEGALLYLVSCIFVPYFLLLCCQVSNGAFASYQKYTAMTVSLSPHCWHPVVQYNGIEIEK